MRLAVLAGRGCTDSGWLVNWDNIGRVGAEAGAQQPCSRLPAPCSTCLLRGPPACLPACLPACRYMADEARSLKAYGELPENSEQRRHLALSPRASRPLRCPPACISPATCCCPRHPLHACCSPTHTHSHPHPSQHLTQPHQPTQSAPIAPSPSPAVRVNDTDALNEEEGGENDDYIDFDDISGEGGWRVLTLRCSGAVVRGGWGV